MPAKVCLQAKALEKIHLHSLKYCHCTVQGILVGKTQQEKSSESVQSDDITLYVEDAFPTFHIDSAPLLPLLELSFQLVCLYRAGKIHFRSM